MDVGRGRNTAAGLIGVGLVVAGALLLLGELGVNLFEFGWPFFVIGPGLLFYLGMIARGRRGAPLAIPGTIITMVGLILLYQNAFDHWESWAYVWTLIFPTAIGLGMIIQGLWGGEPEPARTGSRFVMVGLVMFVALAIFFEGLLNISGFASSAWTTYLAAAALVLAGLLAIASGFRPRRAPDAGS
ncbi:MAG TPA: hypothetical protein VMU89_21705 [Thermomicrobiaceae bacterium]|nr:hypothetical protein [Thermomicrobiaceae bacterium]